MFMMSRVTSFLSRLFHYSFTRAINRKKIAQPHWDGSSRCTVALQFASRVESNLTSARATSLAFRLLEAYRNAITALI